MKLFTLLLTLGIISAANAYAGCEGQRTLCPDGRWHGNANACNLLPSGVWYPYCTTSTTNPCEGQQTLCPDGRWHGNANTCGLLPDGTWYPYCS